MNDHDEIRNLIARYSHCADHNDIEGYVALFASDGELVRGDISTPRDRFPSLMRANAAVTAEQPQPYATRHLQLNTDIAVDGDRATAETDLIIIKLRPDAGWTISNKGRCADELVRENGAWLIRRRVISWDYDLAPDPRDEAFNARLREVMQQASS